MANLAKMSRVHRITKYRGNSDVLDELSYESDVSMDLIKKCSQYESFPTNTRFYASRSDIMNRPYTCAVIDGHPNNVIVDGIGHDGLIIYYHQDQLMWCWARMTNAVENFQTAETNKMITE